MTRYEAPGYYCVTRMPDELPSAGDCIEGRLFVDGDRLVCGAGEMGGMGYADTLDAYSESTVRRLFGNRFDPQEFSLDTAFERDGTVVIPLSAVSSAKLRQWDGSRLRGAEHTFAVCIHAPSALGDPVLLQLGRGGRNRGAGQTRHASLAQWLDALDSGASATASEVQTTETVEAEAETTAAPENAGFAGTTDDDEPAADPDPATPEPQHADASPDAPPSGALEDVAQSTPAGSPAQSEPETADSTADHAETASDAGSLPSPSPTEDAVDSGTDPSVPPEPETADTSADPVGVSNESDRSGDTGSEESEETPQSDPGSEPNQGDGTDLEPGQSGGIDPESDQSGGADPEPDQSDPEPTWLDDEPDEPALIVKNRSNIRLQPRIRCRRGGEVLFLDDIDLAPGDTHRWTDFPEEGVVHLDILFDDGSRKAEQLDERHLRSPPVGIDLYASGVEVHSAD